MKVYHNIENLPAFKNAVVTIGTFDGVHQGHLRIINQLKAEARSIDGETVLVSFDPHPRKIVSKKPLQLLNTLVEKQDLLAAHGIDNLVLVPFTQAFSEQTAEQYIEDFLMRRFHPHTIIIGYDHRFGKNRKGDYALLEKYAAAKAFELIEIPEHVIDEAGISSTKIREALLTSQLEDATIFLGYPYSFEGLVVKGNQLGRTIGYPTANLQPENPDKLIPGNGVYAVTLEIPSTAQHPRPAPYKGMMNIGLRPTIDGLHRVIEVNIFDFKEDIYGETIRIQLRKFLRGEQKFSGLPALQEQLGKDKLQALEAMKGVVM